MHLLKSILLSCFLLLPGFTYAKKLPETPSKRIAPPPPSKNIVYGSIGTAGLWFTGNVNYERAIELANKKPSIAYYGQTGIGYFVTWGGSGPTYTLAGKGILGKNNSHLELGLGIALLHDLESYDIGVSNANYFGESKPSRSEYTYLWPAVTIGYRYKNKYKPLIFRTGISSPDGVYLSLGFGF